MYAEFRHLDGAFMGKVRTVRKDFATIGRHPSADIHFDSERDLDVSGRHAAVFRQGEDWVVRDLGSTNGTWVNGARIKGDRVLAPNDTIRLGQSGPQIVFTVRSGEPATVPVTHLASPPPRERTDSAPEPVPGGSTTGRIRIEVRRQTAAWKRAVVIAGGVAVLAVVAMMAQSSAQRRGFEAERALLLARTDSLLGRMQAASTTVDALTGALSDARRETEQLRAAFAVHGIGAEQAESLSRALALRLDQHEAIVRVAELDVDAVARGNADAVGLVVSEFASGRRVAGSGFALRVRGDTAWIATSRHLVVDSAGRPAARLGVIFNGSSQNFRAEPAAQADSADLAILSVRVRGGVPVVRALTGEAQRGQPVVILGFPLGLDFPVGGDWRKIGVKVSRFTGTVRSRGAERVDIEGYGTSGSSGSPVFNGAGQVTGMVFGGDPSSGGRLVYAVPVRLVEELLRKISPP